MFTRKSNATFALAGALGAALLAMASGPLVAQQNPPQSMHQNAMPMQSAGPADQAYQTAMEGMQRDMPMDFTGDADVDFVRGMIPHHQGAIEMAKAVLAYGKDPEIKKLAENIIAAQETEIALMRGWLEKKGQNPD